MIFFSVSENCDMSVFSLEIVLIGFWRRPRLQFHKAGNFIQRMN